jgi:hypothetical protein
MAVFCINVSEKLAASFIRAMSLPNPEDSHLHTCRRKNLKFQSSSLRIMYEKNVWEGLSFDGLSLFEEIIENHRPTVSYTLQ